MRYLSLLPLLLLAAPTTPGRADWPDFRGPDSSPVLFNDPLILTIDGIDVQYLVALPTRPV